MTLTAAPGWCAPSPTLGHAIAQREEPRVPTWWTAPGSGERYPAWVLEASSPWPIRAPRAGELRFVTPAQRLRWAEEDAWLRRQLRLAAGDV